MIYFCCDSRRREAARKAGLNGMDYLEVLDAQAPTPADRQRTLLVHFLNSAQLAGLTPLNLRIESRAVDGGALAVRVTNVTQRAGDPPEVIAVEVDRPGDFSLYLLRFARDAQSGEPPDGFDPLLSTLEFSFKAECPTEFDCRTDHQCPANAQPEPDIDYLAKDYASFRRLMLDRMRALLPQWNPASPADLGITLTEILAQAADYLSYRQDAIATEAYLGTARLRTSVKRHARLVDYFMHDGCNSRTWVQLAVAGDDIAIARGTPLLAGVDLPPAVLAPQSEELALALALKPAVFELMHDALLFESHNLLRFYTWSDDRCCLPKGATAATLFDDSTQRLRLRAGDVLIFEERVDPSTGEAADADPARRHAVRLTRVRPEATRVNTAGRETGRVPAAELHDPVSGQPIVEIEWHEDDRLPFPLCISSRSRDGQELADVTVALGNLVLADHGFTVEGEPLGTVPQPVIQRVAVSGGDGCTRPDVSAVPARFRPRLAQRPLTQAASFEPSAAASAALQPDPRNAMPALRLDGRRADETTEWRAQRDLLGSAPEAAEFVAEWERDDDVWLRFGDDLHGLRPTAGTSFMARYRVGNGVAGNVGADSLLHVVSANAAIRGARNPMPGTGGTDPESVESVRQNAPFAFRRQERAVTEADYAEVSQRIPRVQRAAGTFRWTGSWHTAFVTVDRQGGRAVDDPFRKEMRAHLEPFRMAGQDVEVDAPRFVPLEIEIQICVAPEFMRSDVKAELLRVFSKGMRPDGTAAVFHPDNFSFGQPVYLSRIYAAAQAVPGVASAHITSFRRYGRKDSELIDAGKLPMGRLEIARLDNDAHFPGRGIFRLTLGGGK